MKNKYITGNDYLPSYIHNDLIPYSRAKCLFCTKCAEFYNSRTTRYPLNCDEGTTYGCLLYSKGIPLDIIKEPYLYPDRDTHLKCSFYQPIKYNREEERQKMLKKILKAKANGDNVPDWLIDGYK